jgi:hypothetical protein
MPIVPDTKNWTWVLESECPECGFDASRVDAHDVPELTRRTVATWSALEYGAHVRDVFHTMAGRFTLMLEHDDPEFENWDQDATAVAERYNEQDPAVVSAQLVDAGLAIAKLIADVPEDAWDRTGRRGDGARFTVATLAQYFIHDPVHHLHDVTK